MTEQYLIKIVRIKINYPKFGTSTDIIYFCQMIKARYIRTSTIVQNTIRQEVRSIPEEIVYIDKVSGSIPFRERPKAKLLFEEIIRGEVKLLSVSAIDRLGRNTLDILYTLDFCEQHKVEIKIDNIGLSSIIEGTGKPNPIFKLITGILSSIAQMERENLLERQREGITEAKRRGTYKGRLKGTQESHNEFLDKHIDIIKELKKNKLTVREVAQMTGKSKSTVMKVKNKLQVVTIQAVAGGVRV